MSSSTRRLFAGLAAAACITAATPAMAQKDPGAPGPVDARITLVARSAAVGVGYTWGDGTLYYNHHSYHFSVRGVSVADVGFSRIVGHGRVYNLHKVADFSGTYAASTGEATAGRGLAGQILVNGAGVQIRVDDVTRGAELAGSADGIQLQLR